MYVFYFYIDNYHELHKYVQCLKTNELIKVELYQTPNLLKTPGFLMWLTVVKLLNVTCFDPPRRDLAGMSILSDAVIRKLILYEYDYLSKFK